MDTSADFQNVLRKKEMGAPVTMRDVAVSIANHDHTLLQYMVDNDYPQVFTLLHHSDSPMTVGRRGTKFTPDKRRTEGELNSLLVRKNWAVLNDIMNHFVINPNTDNYTTDEQLLSELRSIDAVIPGDNGLVLTPRFSS